MAEWLILLLVVPAIVVPVVLLAGFAGCGPDWQGFTVARPTPGFPDPIIISAEGKSACCITLNWTNNNPAIVKFQIERDGQLLPTEPVSSPFDDCGLLADTSYTYRVLAWT